MMGTYTVWVHVTVATDDVGAFGSFDALDAFAFDAGNDPIIVDNHDGTSTIPFAAVVVAPNIDTASMFDRFAFDVMHDAGIDVRDVTTVSTSGSWEHV